MKVKVLCRNPDDYLRETKKDIQKGKLLKWMSNYLLSVSLVYSVVMMRMYGDVADLFSLYYSSNALCTGNSVQVCTVSCFLNVTAVGNCLIASPIFI